MLSWISSLDNAAVLALFSDRTPVLIDFFSFVTQFGDARFIVLLSASMAVVLLRRKHYGYAAGLAVALAGSFASSYALKIIIARGRPLPSLRAIDAVGYSFPSMHATCSMAAYGFLAYMVLRLMHPPHHRAPFIAFLALMVALIGFSRVYLGVHYPSDVIGGYLLGAAFVFAGIETVRAFRARKR